MTADNFTEAARAEAERVRDENSPLEYGTIRATFLDAFLAGAEWARDHLSAQEPTDAERERAVRWLHREREWRPLDGTFIGGTVCNACRRPYPCPTISILDEPVRRGEENR